MGKRLVGVGAPLPAHRDRAYIDGATPMLRRYVDELGRQIGASGTGLLGRERYSSDIPRRGARAALAGDRLAGPLGDGRVWADDGNAELAAALRGAREAARGGLRRAVAPSQRRLGTARSSSRRACSTASQPYGSLTAGALGQLLEPRHAVRARVRDLRPGSREAAGVLKYMLRHGSRLLGLVRAGAYALYGQPVYPVSGTDQVYGHQRRPLPGRQRRGRPARAQPLRLARARR